MIDRRQRRCCRRWNCGDTEGTEACSDWCAQAAKPMTNIIVRQAHLRMGAVYPFGRWSAIRRRGNALADRNFAHFLGITAAGNGRIVADAESPEPGECE